MIIPVQLKKCVVFIGYKMFNGEMKFAGSAFFAGTEETTNNFLVTARHVVEGIRSKGLDEVYIRVNTSTGDSAWVASPISEWRFHPTDSSIDVAVYRSGPNSTVDHLIISTTKFSTEETLRENAVDVGDEVFVVGLFKHHHGHRRNIPIVRVGNLAAMADEKVMTESFGPIDAHLIEARSIGGLSGSPVFLNLGIVRHLQNTFQHSNSGPIHFLFGLVHGHYDVQASQVDDAEEDSGQALSTSRINTGIAIVVPIEKVLETMKAHSI
jgi:hypothetical protein